MYRIILRIVAVVACLWAAPAWSQAIQYLNQLDQPGTIPVSPQSPLPVTSGNSSLLVGPQTPLSPMQAGLAVTSSTALTIPTGATYAVVCAEGQNVRYSTDGTTTPTAAVGMLLLQSQCVSLQAGTTLANFRAIQASATATLDVSYFK